MGQVGARIANNELLHNSTWSGYGVICTASDILVAEIVGNVISPVSTAVDKNCKN